MQVELDALPPDVLHQLFADAIDQYWNDDAHAAAVEKERGEAATLENAS